MSEELKPCPCCGCKNIGATNVTLHYRLVECHDCGLKASSYESLDDAIAKWNRRPAPAVQVPDAILEIGRRMVADAKDNDHCTAHPLFCVEKRRIVTGIDTDYTDEIAWIDEDGNILDDDEAAPLEAAYDETGEVPEGYTRTGFAEEWEHVETYLTPQAAEARINGGKDGRVNVNSAYRNSEMRAVRDFLMSLAAAPAPASSAAAVQVPDGGPLRKLGKRLAELLDEDQFAECEALLLAATPAPATVAPNSNLYGPGSATSPAAAHMLATGAFPAPVATDAVAQEEASNEQIREMALDRLHAIPRVIRHENGNYYNHPDGKLFYADIAIQMAMDIVDDVILACAATWSAATPAEQAVGDLLAVIHGDGGHYQAEHGTEKAARDAISKYNELRATPAYMGSPFEAGAQGGVDVEKVMALVEEYGRDAIRADTAVSPRAASANREIAEETLGQIRALLSAPPAASGWVAEPDMVWNADDPEEGGYTPDEFADYVAPSVGEVSEFEVSVAVSLPNRTMRVWRERDEDGHHDVKWAWVAPPAIANQEPK